MNTNALRLGVSGQSGFRFDSVSVHARALDAAKSTTYAYNTSNQLTSSVTNSVTTTYTYDAWGRLLTRTAGTASASYAYRGDKLKQVTSTFPNEDSVAMNYDGLGRRRNRMANGVTPITWWRYGLGWDTVAEYTDNDTDWAVEGFSKFNVMTDFMHPLAEATVASGQPPANAAYSYLALDHLSSTRGVFSQTKTQTGTMEFLPYGARHTATGTLPHHQFTAKPYDTGTGLYTFPFRHYSPAMARWTGADTAGLVDGPNVYGYGGSRPTSVVDADGKDWGTLDFIWHYYFGGGRTINLEDVGLGDDYRRNTEVRSFVSYLINTLDMLVRGLAKSLFKSCLGSSGTKSGSAYYGDYTLITFDEMPWISPLYVMGDGYLYGNGRCGVKVDCCTGCYHFSCSANFSQNDSFKDPIGMGIEPPISTPVPPFFPLYPNPYDIIVYWSQQWGGAGCMLR